MQFSRQSMKNPKFAKYIALSIKHAMLKEIQKRDIAQIIMKED
jgi:hypothetical protein